MRSSAGAFPQLSENWELAAVNDGDIRQLDSQFGGAFDAAGFADVLHFANQSLAAPGNNPAIDHERLVQRGGELVANPVFVAGEEIRGADDKDGARWDG